jgi:hypothetical protein
VNTSPSASGKRSNKHASLIPLLENAPAKARLKPKLNSTESCLATLGIILTSFGRKIRREIRQSRTGESRLANYRLVEHHW